jgi:hypothetical protein
MLPEHIATGMLPLIERLSPSDGLCHCDLPSDNVIVTAAVMPLPRIVYVFALLAGGVPCPAGAADPPHRSNPTLGTIIFSRIQSDLHRTATPDASNIPPFVGYFQNCPKADNDYEFLDKYILGGVYR